MAPTDCRLRPDQHFLELGQYDQVRSGWWQAAFLACMALHDVADARRCLRPYLQANIEKQRLEHKQRAARKAAERGDPIRPRWFDVAAAHKRNEELGFRYKGGYWEERAAGHFTGCRDIFGPHVAES